MIARLILDQTQSIAEGEAVKDLLEAGIDAGPDGTRVIARGWTWKTAPLILVLVTTDN